MMKKEIPKIKIYVKSDSSSSIHPYQSVTNQNKNKISLFFENNLDIKKKIKKVDELREVCFFKEGYEPRWEEEYYIDGSKYLCSIQIYENSEFRKMIEEMIKMILLRYKNMVGIRIKKKKQKKYDIQFWTIELKENSKLVEKINHIFHSFHIRIIESIRHETFFAPPSNMDPTLSMKKIRNKQIYFLRYDLGVGQSFRRGFYWEDWMFKYMKEYYKPNTNMIDIGGNMGTHSLLMSEIVSKDSFVYCFEPFYADIIHLNITKNHLQDKIILFDCALGNENKIIDATYYNRTSRKPYGSIRLEETNQNRTFTKKVAVLKLDSFHFTNISFIKLDVETYELQVLEGAKETISLCKPVIVMEILSSEKERMLKSEIMKYILHDLHYQLKPIHEGINDYLLLPNS